MQGVFSMTAVYYPQQMRTPGGDWTQPPAWHHTKETRMGRPPLYPTDPKPCVVCGTTMVKRQREHAYTFYHRKYCNRTCGIKARSERQRATFPDRSCVICGKPIVRKPKEIALAFGKRKTCGPKCGATQAGRTLRKKAETTTPRYCVVCGVLLEQKQREPRNDFIRRLTCDPQCARKRSIATALGRYGRSSPYPPEWGREVRSAIRERDNHTCQICGATPGTRAHDVHHIDGVKANIDQSNLITLCHPCHAKVTTGDKDYWFAIFAAMMQEESQ
jgi:5-methylcytosine-specific restriction endonuclease McrA